MWIEVQKSEFMPGGYTVWLNMNEKRVLLTLVGHTKKGWTGRTEQGTGHQDTLDEAVEAVIEYMMGGEVCKIVPRHYGDGIEPDK